MNTQSFRQNNAWLHTWISLLPGWLLYAVFFTGTLSFFQDEITFWMKPELHASQPQPDTALQAVTAMQALAPGAALWQINLPTERYPVVNVRWFAPGEPMGRGSGEQRTLDAGTLEPVSERETRGAGFLYRFHFELYGLPRVQARWVVGIATMMMLIAIVTGVVTHKKIFKDFFTFRPRKGQRSWLDAHNALAVLALPFHFMITYSGLLLFMFLMMPWGMDAAYDGDRRAFFSETRSRGAPMEQTRSDGDITHAALTDITPLLAAAQREWPNGVGSVQVSQPGRSNARITLREHGGHSLVDRGNSRQMTFDGVTGERLPDPAGRDVSSASAVYNIFTSLHLIRFAGPVLRWLMFISGVLGTLMVATGLVLWVVKRLPERRKLGRTPFGHRLVETLNVGTIAGLPVATAVYFWANRLLPVSVAQRSDWEIRLFFIAWALCLLHPLLRTHRQAWREQLALCALLLTLLPWAGLLTGDGHLASHLLRGQWLPAFTDMTLLAFAALFALAVRYLRTPPAPQPKRRAAPVATQGEAA
jgi:uncharacterized iron-regulated membrane protein